MSKVGLIGFGKIGQAIASQILLSGQELIAFDTDPTLATSLAAAQYSSSEPGVGVKIIEAFSSGQLSIQSDMSALKHCTAVLVCIPLLVVEPPSGSVFIDYKPFDDCFRLLATIVHSRMLISLETTVPIGTCRKRLVALFAEYGKTHGIDYLLAFSPERIMSNTMLQQLTTTPKIVGALTVEALESAESLYKSFLPAHLVKTVSSLEIAEMIKLAAMVHRDLNLALINQLAVYCETANIDVREVLSLVNTDNVTHVLYPGIGVGGHCTPVYPYFLIDNFAERGMTFSLAVEARRVNDSMSDHIINKVCEELSLTTALILGLGFRPNVKEDAFSPSYKVNNVLKKNGITTYLCDPLYSELEITNKGFEYASDPYTRQYDIVILVTAHDDFVELDFAKLAQQGCKLVVDGRNAFNQAAVLAAGMAYRGVGTGCTSNKPALAVEHE